MNRDCRWCPTKSYERFPDSYELYTGKGDKRNPGSVQELHILAHKVMPKFFDGIEMDFTPHIAPNKIITCNWVLSHTRPSGFRFGGIYSLPLEDSVLQTPIIQADINPTTFASNVGVLWYPISCLRLDLSLQRSSDDIPLMTTMTMELIRPYATLTGNLYNVRRDSGRGTLSFMRAITKHLALGGELLIEWNEPHFFMADVALAMRYAHSNWLMAASASRQGIDVSYWQRLNKRLQMASMLAWHRKTEKAIATVCYQWNFNNAVVRGMFDSDQSVGFSYTRFLQHIPLSIGMSLLISLPTSRFIFGLKFNLNPSGLKRGE